MKKLLILFLLMPSLSWGGWWLVSEQSTTASGGGSSPEVLYPTSDTSDYNWVASSGATDDLWPMVDDTTADDASTYITSRESYRYVRFGIEATALTTETITSVTIKARVRAATATTVTARGALYDGANTYQGTDVTGVGQTWQDVSFTWITNPETTSAWAIVDIDDFSYSFATASDDPTNIDVTQLFVEVAYE